MLTGLGQSAENRTVRLWDVASGLPLSDWIHSHDPVASVAFAADGQAIIASAGWRWEIAVVNDAAPAWLPDLAEAVADGDGARLRMVGQAVSSLSQQESIARWTREFLADALEANQR